MLKNRRRIEGTRALLTGASSGIGRALALELARCGGRCLLIARREERLHAILEEAKNLHLPGELVMLQGDVTDPDLPRRALETMADQFGGIDILINNAGVGAMGRFEDSRPERLRHLMEVNLFALAEMTRLAIPELKLSASDSERSKTQGRPVIVNIGSILGLVGSPHNSEYAATKFAVTGFSESLRAELSPENIDVYLVNPGTTETEFFDQLIEKTSEPKFPEHKAVTSEYVAQKIVRGIQHGARRSIPYRPACLIDFLHRLSPRLADMIMSRYA
jgi:short-subunit dehydrogenase